MKNYQYLLFDWDGTLAQTLQIHLESYKETFAEYDIFPTDSEVTKRVFGDWNGPMKLGVSQDDLSDFTDKYLSRVDKNFAKAPLYPGVEEMIKHFTNMGKQLALVTTSTNRLVKPALINTKLKDFFSVVLAAEDVSEHKPSPEIIEKALERLGGDKEEAIIIGDSKSDLGAALAASIDSVFFYPNDHQVFYHKESLISEYKPTFVIEKHQDLKDILR